MELNISEYLNKSLTFGCASCESIFFKPAQPSFCPVCGEAKVHQIDFSIDYPEIEILIPHQSDPRKYEEQLLTFIKPVEFKPLQLNISTLKQNAQWVFIPVWLVDSQVAGHWEAEFGFNYSVESSVEKLQNGQWQTIKTQETRIDWAPRAGTLNKYFNNIAFPAQSKYETITKIFGEYQIQDLNKTPKAFNLTDQTALVVPNIDKHNGWKLAVEQINKIAGKNCEKAAQAEHTKSFTPEFEYSKQNWTLLLAPYMVTSYLDENNYAHPIWINGQTLKIDGDRYESHGDRYESRDKGNRFGTINLIIAFAALLATLLFGILSTTFDYMSLFGVFSIIAAFSFFIASLHCFTHPARWNKKNTGKFKN